MPSISPELKIEVQEFLWFEASLLEDNRLEEWLGLMSDDVHYVMPVRRNTQPRTGAKNTDDEAGFTLYDDDKGSLTLRVRRLATGIAHAETPPSVTQRFITNVRVEHSEDGQSLWAHSNFLVYQERRGRHNATFIGKRRDRLSHVGGLLKIAERHIMLAQAILPTTISIFF